MGTSVNQRSPSTPNWQVATTTYMHSDIPINRVINEIWRAASKQPEGDLLEQLSASLVAECMQIVEASNTREEAVYSARRHVAASGQTSLVLDIAIRAVANSFLHEADKSLAFSQSLFSETGNYLVSRDLPGFVGKIGRVANISEAIEFKESIKNEISETIKLIPLPRGVSQQPTKWDIYVREVVEYLSGGR